MVQAKKSNFSKNLEIYKISASLRCQAMRYYLPLKEGVYKINNSLVVVIKLKDSKWILRYHQTYASHCVARIIKWVYIIVLTTAQNSKTRNRQLTVFLITPLLKQFHKKKHPIPAVTWKNCTIASDVAGGKKLRRILSSQFYALSRPEGFLRQHTSKIIQYRQNKNSKTINW